MRRQVLPTAPSPTVTHFTNFDVVVPVVVLLIFPLLDIFNGLVIQHSNTVNHIHKCVLCVYIPSLYAWWFSWRELKRIPLRKKSLSWRVLCLTGKKGEKVLRENFFFLGIFYFYFLGRAFSGE